MVETERSLAAIRADFPILATSRDGKPLVYLDNAATSQKPAAVLDAMSDYYARYNANVHRGVYAISEEATAAYEGARADRGALPRRRGSGGDSLHPQHHRGDQPGGL